METELGPRLNVYDYSLALNGLFRYEMDAGYGVYALAGAHYWSGAEASNLYFDLDENRYVGVFRDTSGIAPVLGLGAWYRFSRLLDLQISLRQYHFSDHEMRSVFLTLHYRFGDKPWAGLPDTQSERIDPLKARLSSQPVPVTEPGRQATDTSAGDKPRLVACDPRFRALNALCDD
jgi:hypothetical protein